MMQRYYFFCNHVSFGNGFWVSVLIPPPQGLSVAPNSIFLPAAGYRLNGDLNSAGSNGGYWSSSLDESRSYNAYFLFYSRFVDWYNVDYRCYGFSVRPVCP